MADEQILFDDTTQPGTGIVVLARERALNCLTTHMVTALAARLRAWAADGAVRRVVLVGAGPKAFCAGGDIKAIAVAAHAGDLATCNAFFTAECGATALEGGRAAPTADTSTANRVRCCSFSAFFSGLGILFRFPRRQPEVGLDPHARKVWRFRLSLQLFGLFPTA